MRSRRTEYLFNCLFPVVLGVVVVTVTVSYLWFLKHQKPTSGLEWEQVRIAIQEAVDSIPPDAPNPYVEVVISKTNGVLVTAATGFPDEQTLNQWLAETSRLESGDWDLAWGDAGLSRGRYQITEPVWKAYSKVPWEQGALDRTEATRVARAILLDCCKACVSHHQPITFTNVRYWYTHGGFPTPTEPHE